MHSSKGLEFTIMLIPGIGYMPHQYKTPKEETQLLYVAMTRAIEQTSDRSSQFTSRLETVLGKVAVI
ncbi:hypothetical protein GNF10_26905 [Nostoc sp. UCD121]|uniref:3'-5' exonuclease n=1 Tax=unclassified Nostoc TaxID=2593658 RepID=UPI0016260836|nr:MULTISPECIES: 3'-5' exonuclease [unclassified Nostoc]MBC1221029.1 hypothetical protein [Nostoc sp. UCD120]MBC1279488.1 hypothetical protein [Nostoc sp. UCD121]MBC1295274.1 hypothetical protein [Nostoc sp. UCD122]